VAFVTISGKITVASLCIRRRKNPASLWASSGSRRANPRANRVERVIGRMQDATFVLPSPLDLLLLRWSRNFNKPPVANGFKHSSKKGGRH